MAFSGVYTEIVPGRRFVYTQIFEPMPDAGVAFLAPLDPLVWDREFLRRLFEPLGYAVEATPIALDETVPAMLDIECPVAASQHSAAAVPLPLQRPRIPTPPSIRAMQAIGRRRRLGRNLNRRCAVPASGPYRISRRRSRW